MFGASSSIQEVFLKFEETSFSYSEDFYESIPTNLVTTDGECKLGCRTNSKCTASATHTLDSLDKRPRAVFASVLLKERLLDTAFPCNTFLDPVFQALLLYNDFYLRC